MSPLYQDPHWPRASAWIEGDHVSPALGFLAVLGAPLALGSITPGRCDLAPSAIRAALQRYSSYDVEAGRDLRQLQVRDLGDLDLAALRPEQALQPLAEAVSSALASAEALVLLGGDNSVTRPGCHGTARPLSSCGLLTFDAHFDLRDLGGGFNNGNPVRALLADGLPGANVVQIGIQSFVNSKAYADVARKFGLGLVTADQVQTRGIDTVVQDALEHLGRRADVIYVDLDLDVLDRAYAPATPGSRPGGLAPWQLRRAARLCGLYSKVKVIDLVEIDPTQDIAGATALAAGACMLAFAAGLHERLEVIR